MSEARARTDTARPPAVLLRGILGWGNRKAGLDAYGPDGRWGGDEHGDLLGDALERAGAGEADTLVVVAIPLRQPHHDKTVAAVETAIEAALSGSSAVPPPVPQEGAGQ